MVITRRTVDAAVKLAEVLKRNHKLSMEETIRLDYLVEELADIHGTVLDNQAKQAQRKRMLKGKEKV